MRFCGFSGPLSHKVMPRLGSVCLLSAILAAPWAAAEPTGGGETTLDQVVVTAQKRSEDVQKIGVAVSAMSGKEMETLRLQQPLDLAYVSPSLSTLNAQTDSTQTEPSLGMTLWESGPLKPQNRIAFLRQVHAARQGNWRCSPLPVGEVKWGPVVLQSV